MVAKNEKTVQQFPFYTEFTPSKRGHPSRKDTIRVKMHVMFLPTIGHTSLLRRELFGRRGDPIRRGLLY